MFIATLHSIVDVDDDFSFPIKITNTAEHHICICCGELLSFVTRAKDALRAAASLSESEQVHFDSQASQLAVLVPLLDARKEQTLLTTRMPLPNSKKQKLPDRVPKPQNLCPANSTHRTSFVRS